MSASYRQVFYHIVFATKHREPTIADAHCQELYRFIWDVIRNRNCKLYQINGVEDHLHLLVDLHPSVALATLLRDIKSNSSFWMKESGMFPEFQGWQTGYGAFTCSFLEKNRIIGYIKKQKEHHRQESSATELKRLLNENGVPYEDTYFE